MLIYILHKLPLHLLVLLLEVLQLHLHLSILTEMEQNRCKKLTLGCVNSKSTLHSNLQWAVGCTRDHSRIYLSKASLSLRASSLCFSSRSFSAFQLSFSFWSISNSVLVGASSSGLTAPISSSSRERPSEREERRKWS